MTDPRFYRNYGPFSLHRIARIAETEIPPGADPEKRFVDVAPLQTAGPDDVGFLDNRAYLTAFKKSKAGVCVLRDEHADAAPKGMITLVCEDPYRSYARIADAFYPQQANKGRVSPHAHVASDVTLGANVEIEPGAVIESGVQIGANSHIGANAVIGANCIIGQDCRIGPGAGVAYCIMGDRVILHPGVRIGQDGFGFAMGPDGHLKVPQLGLVLIEEDVEIGANSTIDRGTGPNTVIGAGCKIDNLVQIGHNVELGKNCVLAGQVGISGSTKAGDFAMMGGQVGLAGHLHIGAGAKIMAKSGVFRDVAPGETIAGIPAMPAKTHWRQVAMLARLVRKKGD